MRRNAARWIAAALGALVLVAAAATYFVYERDLRAVRERLLAGSRIVETRHGQVEFAEWGAGPAVIALHGAGGGYDQGRLLAEAFGGEGFRWIAPSRFGYLRSALPADASTAAQADALADVLDARGVAGVALVAMSGGVPPALQFALRHPARVRALVLISSAPYTPLSAADQRLPLPAWAYQALFATNFPYWVLTKAGRPLLETIYDVKPALRDRLAGDDGSFVDRMVDAFLPVTARTGGLANEGAAIDPRARYALAALAVPTLVVHARDDAINPFAFGEHTAKNIAGSRLVALPAGGHLLLGHHAEVRAQVSAFLREHAGPGPRAARRVAP